MLTNVLCLAQSSTTYFAETVLISTNTTTFVSGENLYYKIDCLNSNTKQKSDLSKIAYVELVSSDKQVLSRQKLFLTNGTQNGTYFINSEIKTGCYKLICYTNWMLNNEQNKYSDISVFIINPFENYPKKAKSISEKSDTLHNVSPNKNISITIDKKEYSPREKGTLKIKLNELTNLSLSLSIRKKEELPIINDVENNNFIEKIIPQQINYKSDNLTLPELRGELVSGVIINKNDISDINNKTIALSISGQNSDYKIVKTNSKGEFNFNINKPYTNSNQIIQVLENNKEDFTLHITEKKIPNYDKLSFAEVPKLTADYKQILETRSIANQIENAYNYRKEDTIENLKTNLPFYDPWQKTYILDNYTRFSTLAETITEVIFEMYYTKVKNNYTIGLRDFELINDTPEPPLVMIDGTIIQDINELFEYKMANVYKIVIVQGGYFYGSNVFNGLINLVTKNFDYKTTLTGDFILNANLVAPNLNRKYFNQSYSNKAENERIPDYRYQLLWKPELLLKEKENTVSFYTSDIKGVFEYTVQGVIEAGVQVLIKGVFEVK